MTRLVLHTHRFHAPNEQLTLHQGVDPVLVIVRILDLPGEWEPAGGWPQGRKPVIARPMKHDQGRASAQPAAFGTPDVR